jgi:hypothetical protein
MTREAPSRHAGDGELHAETVMPVTDSACVGRPRGQTLFAASGRSSASGCMATTTPTLADYRLHAELHGPELVLETAAGDHLEQTEVEA